jgi:hypothetical protein
MIPRLDTLITLIGDPNIQQWPTTLAWAVSDSDPQRDSLSNAHHWLRVASFVKRSRKYCAISAVCALSFLPWGRGIYGFRGWDGRPDAGGTSPAWLEVMG